MLKKKRITPNSGPSGRLSAGLSGKTPSSGPVSVPDVVDAEAVPAQSAMDRLLRPDEVAHVLGVSERTLERWRMEGTGPRYLSLSRKVVRYEAGDLRAFLESRSRTNTAA